MGIHRLHSTVGGGKELLTETGLLWAVAVVVRDGEEVQGLRRRTKEWTCVPPA